MYKVKIKKLPNLPQARRGGSYLNYYQMAPSFTSGSLSNPELDYSQKLGPVDRDVANVEVEKNEKILMPGGDALGGMLTMYTAGGKRHAEGGTPLNLPEGAFVFSDFHGKDFRLGGNTKTKVMDRGILAYFGLPDRKGGYTFADIAAKYDINKDVANLMDPTEVKDKMTMDTLMYNIKNKTKKLGALAIAQESKKGEGAPKMAMPFIASMNMDPKDFDIPKISVDEMPFYQNIMKGAQQMDQQKAMMQQQQEAQASGMGMEDLAQGAPQGQMQAPEQGGMEEQYAQDMGQYMQRMGGSSFPNPYYPGRIPEEMPQAMLGYQVFRNGGSLSKFTKNTNNPYLKKAALGMAMGDDPCPPDHFWDENQKRCIPFGEGVPSREQFFDQNGPYNEWQDELNYNRQIEDYKDWLNKKTQEEWKNNYKGPDDYNSPEWKQFQDEVNKKYPRPKSKHNPNGTEPGYFNPEFELKQDYFPQDQEWDERSKYLYDNLFDIGTDDYRYDRIQKNMYREQHPETPIPRHEDDPELYKKFIQENIKTIKPTPSQLRQQHYDDWCPCMKKEEIFVEGKPVMKDVCVPCEEMPKAMLGYQVFSRGGGLNRFIRRQEGGPAMMPPEAMAQQAPPQGGGGGGQMEQIAAQVQQALQQGAQPEEVAAALLEKGIPPQAIAQIFVSIGMPEEQVMSMISQVTQQMPAEASDMEAMAQYGMQIFAKGGSAGKLDRFISYAKKGLDEFDPESIVNRSYNRRKGVYIYTDANGNKYETTQPDLAVAGMPERSNTGSGGSNSVPPTQTTPTYDIPKDAVVIERKKDESAEDWAKRKQEAYDKAVDKGRVYIKSEDKYYRVGNRKKGYGEYKGPAEELKKVFNDNKDLAAMYQKLEETFKDPKIQAEYVKRVREAVKNDENLGSKAKGDFKTKILNGTITDAQIVQAFLDHNKRNIGFAAHKRNVADTPQKELSLEYTSEDLDKWSKEMGLPITRANVMLEQLAYIGYRDLITNRDNIADAEVKSKLAPFEISQFGKADEITAMGEGKVSDSDEYYMNTTAGQVASINPGTELYDEELKAKKESEIVPPGEIGAIAKRPPAKPWLQNIIGTGMALTQDVNRYMPIRTTVPYIGQVDPQFISPVYQSQVATSMGRGMMEGMAPYLGDQVASSRQSQLYGEIADKAAQAAAAVEQANAGEATKTNATNLGVRLQGAQAQAAADSEYNTNVIGSKAIFDKNLQLKNVNIYANTVATLDNMARTDATNYVFGDEFNINGMNPFNPIQQIRGKSPNGQVSGDPGGSLMAAYQAALKNPDFAGMDKEDIKDLVIAEYNKSVYANTAANRKKTLANSIMGAYMSPVAANNPMMSALSAYTQGMNPYTNAANDQGF